MEIAAQTYPEEILYRLNTVIQIGLNWADELFIAMVLVCALWAVTEVFIKP